MNAFSLPPRPHGWRPPRYASATDCLAAALPSIAPLERRTVPDWAAAKRRLSDNGSIVPWRNEVVPYMVEPAVMTSSRRYRAVGFAGPARTAKTAALIENKIGQIIECEPGDVRVIHMDQQSARTFSKKKVAALIRHSPSLKERQPQERGADNLYDKRFLGDMMLDIGWPVISHLSGFEIPTMLLTDYDRMPEDIDGEGNPFDLAMKRTQTAGSLGMTIAESSPGRLLLDEDWKPNRRFPHMAPPTSGILALYNRGTRGRWFWTCPDCGNRFEPDFPLLVYPKEGTPAERGREAEMMCPHCGVTIAARHKRDLNLAGAWLHEAADGSLVAIDDERIRDTDIVSYWLKGPAAAFQSWTELVTRYETAIEEFERTGDETSLKTTVNVDQGHPHKPRSLGMGSDITVQSLKERAERTPLGVAPQETRFVLVSVDVQKGRFVVQFEAFAPEMERWLIERREIHTPPEGAPGADKRAIDPAHYREDWAVLFDLLDEVFPVAGTGLGIRPAALIVDSGGESGVTDKAYAFYRKAMREGYRRRIHILKGMSGWERDRAVEIEPRKENRKRRKGRSDLTLVQIGTWKLKSELLASLSRKEPGPGAYHLSDELMDQAFEELCAERKTPKGFELKQGQKRNEALDLAVYSLALAIVLGAEKIDWAKPPAWAAEAERNSFAVPLDAPKDDPAPQTPIANTGSASTANWGSGWIPKRNGWL
jgi:phage terminase large subunit GpA-like protein